MAIEVHKPGLATTVQDLGRPGYYDVGIPLSGAMDRFALIAGNLLVGNSEDAAALEIVFLGPELRFSVDAVVAVTGADMPARVDGAQQPAWECFQIRAGQTLAFDFLKRGARAYLCVAGGIDVPIVLGSRSTYVLGALGGHQGRALQKGDVLPLGQPERIAAPGRAVPTALRRGVVPTETLRMLPGLYEHRVTREALAGFFADTWKVATEADRIGYRFRGGTKLTFVEREPPFGAGSDPSNIVDSCYPYGSIQMPGGTEPIVLHRDAVSGGGYFMLGTVISADMDFIGQLQPHSPVRFVPVSLEDSLAARAEYNAMLQLLRSEL